MTIEECNSSPTSIAESDCRVVSPSQTDLWEEAINSITPEARFLCSDWTSLLQKTYGYEPSLIVLKEKDTIKGVTPFVIVRSILTGTRAVSLPFFDICNSYATSKAHIMKLYEAFRNHGKRQGWNYIELRGDIDNLQVEDPSLSFYNHVVDLSKGPDAIFANMASSTRRAIRKAEKNGIRIEFSDSEEALKGFYDLQYITRKRHGLPPQPFKFFANLRKALIETGHGTIITAYHKDELAASGIYLEQGRFCHYKYGASDVRFQESRCNNYVMWNAMKYFSERGFEKMDLGRNSLENESLRKYKQTYGPTERLTSYLRYNLKSDTIEKMTDDVYGWHNKFFRILPRPLAQLAGKLIYKHIA